VSSAEALAELQDRIWSHRQSKSEAAALECDEPGGENSGAKVCFVTCSPSSAANEQGVEYPTRFFVRDFAGNRLEFAVFSG
jgi:hypothetical protein